MPPALETPWRGSSHQENSAKRKFPCLKDENDHVFNNMNGNVESLATTSSDPTTSTTTTTITIVTTVANTDSEGWSKQHALAATARLTPITNNTNNCCSSSAISVDTITTSQDHHHHCPLPTAPLTDHQQQHFSSHLNRLSLIDEWPEQQQNGGTDFSSGEGFVVPGTSHKKAERKELERNNTKRSGTSGLGFHRRQGSGDLYTKLQHFDNGGDILVPCSRKQQQQHFHHDNYGLQSSSSKNGYVGRGYGTWGDFDDPLFSQTTTSRGDEILRSPAAKPHAGKKSSLIPESSQYEVFPGSTLEGIPLPPGTGGGGSGGVLGLKEWYKNRTLVSKATSKTEAPPKPKYLRKLVLSSWKHNGSGAVGIFNMLSKRPLQSSPVTALKALITIHKLLQQGAPDCQPACYNKLPLLNDIATTFRSQARTVTITTAAAAEPYNLLVSSYASLLVEKVSFHDRFPAYESNYSVALSAITSTIQPSGSGEVFRDLPRANAALSCLQQIQDMILVALELGFALLRKKYTLVGENSTTAGIRMVPVSGGGGRTSGLVANGESNPIELVVAMLIPVLREADLLYGICWFLLSSQLSAWEAGCHDIKVTRKFEEQHKALRNFFEQAKSEVAITCTVTPPNLPVDPPCPTVVLDHLPNKDIPLRLMSHDQENAGTTFTLDSEPGALLDDFGADENEVERPKSVPLAGHGSLDDQDVDVARVRNLDDSCHWENESAGQPSVAGKVIPTRQQLQEVSAGPVVGGVGAAAAAAMQRFAAGQAEARRAAAAAETMATPQAGLKNIRLEPPPCTLGSNLKLESGGTVFFRPEKPQHTRGIGRKWSSFDDEAFLHQKLVPSPWSPIPNLVTPKFYSPRAPGPSKDVGGMLSPCNCKSSSPLLFALLGPSQMLSKPLSPFSTATSPPPALPVPSMELKHCPLIAALGPPLFQTQQVQDQPAELQQAFSKCPNVGQVRLERPETPPMIEMDTPVVGQSARQQAAEQQLGNNVPEEPHMLSVPPASWQLDGSMSDVAAWSTDYACPANPGDLVEVCYRKETPTDIPLAADWEIPACELILGPKIGQGAFGDVLRGTWQGTDVAVKRLQNNFGAANYFQAIEEIRHEVAVIMRLRHPNIILFMGACTIPPEICIVMEFAANGSLFGVLHNPNIAIDLATVVRWASEAARGMNYLHTRNPPVVHRDLKSVNLLVDGDWHIKVSDFGLAMTKQSSYAYTQVGTWGWMAPEVLESAPYNEKADVYSFGVVLWELITREEPFKGYHPMQIMRAIDRGERPPIPQSCPQLYQRLITDCWHANPKCRPVFVEILVRLGDMSNNFNSLVGHQRRTSSERCNILPML